MWQLFHIFKKDIRGLSGELGVFLGALVLACFSFVYGSPHEGRFDLEGSRAGELLVLMAGSYLIARLIHAETIPGSAQFWLTRPYRWPSLLGSKALFILVFAHLPVFVAQAVLLWLADFPVLENLAALLWTQVLMLACVSLPVAGIAAVTRGLAGFALFIIGGWALGSVATLPFYLAARWAGLEFASSAGQTNTWVTWAILIVTLAAAALSVLYAQYSKRKTSLSRVLFAGICLTGLVFSSFGRVDRTWTIQALASTQPMNTTSLQFSLGEPTWMGARKSDEWFAAWPPASFDGTNIDIHLPLFVAGVASGSRVGAENVFLSFEAADGETSRTDSVRIWGFLGSDRIEKTSGGLRFPLSVSFADGKFYEKLRNRPATVRGYIDLLAIGNERSLTVPRMSFPVNVTPAFRCGLEYIRPTAKDLSCRVAFRWPFQTIDVAGRGSFVRTESLSPFPADLRLNPFLYRFPAFGLSDSEPNVEFILREPVSFVRKEFVIPNVQLIEGPSTETDWRGR